MMSPKKILIVDDDAVFVMALSLLLRAKGYQVLTAEDGASTISMVRREKPDLILLDLNFPPDVAHGGTVNWNGFRIMEWLRRMDEAKGVPIIITTGEDPAKNKERCRAPEVAGYFRKPVDHEELLASIRRALDGKVREEPPPKKLPGATKILFVDDENDWRYMATMYLTDSGYEVWTARNAAEALRQAERVKPDLIILDLNLGGESGLAVMKLLKGKHPGVPVLLYTGMEYDQSAIQAMLREGAQQYLPKTTMGEMLRAVQIVAGGLPQPKPAAGKKAWDRTVQTFGPHPESVLLLEDDSAFGESLQLFLESHSFFVTRVASGAEGLRQVAATDFDIILYDLVMPGLPGDQFYLAVERIKPHLCNRFVFMTDRPADPKTDAFIRRVRGLMLWKPFPLADLLTAIASSWKNIPEASGRRPLPPIA
jgi:CheY-like chemotaxis protein